VITIRSNYDLNKTIGEAERCCLDHEPIYEITYSLGHTWLVCFFCKQDDVFSQNIREIVRVRT